MLDQVIHKHLDRFEVIEDELKEDLETIIKQMDIDAIFEDPQAVLSGVATIIEELIVDKYAERSLEEGIKFAQEVEGHRGKIVIDKSKDPTLNEDVVE